MTTHHLHSKSGLAALETYMKQNNDDDPDAANHHRTAVAMTIIAETSAKTNPFHAPPLWRKGSADYCVRESRT